MDNAYIVVLQDNPSVYLSSGQGDPCRTYLRKSAAFYATEKGAKIALGIARKYRPFKRANIEKA